MSIVDLTLEKHPSILAGCLGLLGTEILLRATEDAQKYFCAAQRGTEGLLRGTQVLLRGIETLLRDTEAARK